ncbi:MAG: UDP-3-O-(3-hydroxymyristoyl)glucosamine N-acyltransferase [Hyphomonas sp.]
MSLGQAAELTGADLAGDADFQIAGIASSAHARPGELAFLDGDGRAAPDLSPALQAVVTTPAMRGHVPEGVSVLETRFARHAHSVIAKALFRPRHLMPTGSERLNENASIHPKALIAPGAVVGAGAAIGEGTVVLPNAVIGPGVQIGRNCVIGAGVSIICALIGDHVSILSGARIGEAGFGVLSGPAGAEDAPHFGRVIIQDHVTIGANTCIDRGVFEDTIIGERTKIDNLCQIAHNVQLGRSVIVAAFGGISGSVRVGDGSMLGGRVGIADHVTVGERVSLAASAGLFRDVDAGETWGGTPAKPIRQWMREIAWLQKQTNPKKTS